MGNLTHKELYQQGAKWLNKFASNIFYRCQFVCIELSCQGTREIPDILGLRPYGHVMIEVKVSRADFLKDFKKPHRSEEKPLANYSFYLAPEGLIKEDELPENWGLLVWDGNKVVMTKAAPMIKENDKEAMNYVYYSVIRRELKPGVFDYRKTPNKK